MIFSLLLDNLSESVHEFTLEECEHRERMNTVNAMNAVNAMNIVNTLVSDDKRIVQILSSTICMRWSMVFL